MGYEALKKLSSYAVVAAALSACSAPVNDIGSALGKQAILDEVNGALNVGDCVGALNRIAPLYNSSNSDNEVRMITASVYACHAGLNFFGYLDSLTQNGPSLAGPSFWAYLTAQFPSTVGDYHAEGAVLSIDALLSVIRSGIPILPSSQINPGYNPGSILMADRTTDANSYLTFVTMATIGAFQSRFGNPYANGKKGSPLPWTTAGAVTPDACNYASAILNMVDSMGALADASTALNSSVTAIQGVFQTAIYQACDWGCQNTAVPIPGWIQSGCTIPGAQCASCPLTLRNRAACSGAANDIDSCAVAGIVNFINVSPTGWQDGP